MIVFETSNGSNPPTRSQNKENDAEKGLECPKSSPTLPKPSQNRLQTLPKPFKTIKNQWKTIKNYDMMSVVFGLASDAVGTFN